MSVDRDKEDGPYSIENIKMMPLGDNVRKSLEHRHGITSPDVPYTEEEKPW